MYRQPKYDQKYVEIGIKTQTQLICFGALTLTLLNQKLLVLAKSVDPLTLTLQNQKLLVLAKSVELRTVCKHMQSDHALPC